MEYLKFDIESNGIIKKELLFELNELDENIFKGDLE